MVKKISRTVCVDLRSCCFLQHRNRQLPPCLTSVPEGEIAAHGIFLAGAWQACSDTWFAAQAILTHLPLTVR